MVKRYGFKSFGAFGEEFCGEYVLHRDYASMEDAFSRWKVETSKDVKRIDELNTKVATLEALLSRALATGQLHSVRNPSPPHLADEIRTALAAETKS